MTLFVCLFLRSVQKPVARCGGKAFRPVVPKCARLQRLRRAAGCFGEIASSSGTGRGLCFLVRRVANRNSPHPHPNAAVQNRGLTADNKTAGLVPKTQALPL